MKRQRLWRISITTTPEAEDAVVQWLEQQTRQAAVSWTDAETRRTAVTSYFDTRPDWAALRPEMRRGLQHIARCGLRIGSGRISIERIRREDWAESWKRHFKAIEVRQALLVKPGWSRRQPRRGEALVVLDPGLSFGTGHHPTTRFCLEQLVACRPDAGRILPRTSRSFLDIGTGSGILAIAAAKLGYAPVDAFDFDREAVRVAAANVRRNRTVWKLRLFRADLTTLPRRTARRYDVVCANLVSTLLISERVRILARLKPGGVLVLAGILKQEFADVRQAYQGAGLKCIAADSENEWQSGAFQRPRGSC